MFPIKRPNQSTLITYIPVPSPPSTNKPTHPSSNSDLQTKNVVELLANAPISLPIPNKPPKLEDSAPKRWSPAPRNPELALSRRYRVELSSRLHTVSDQERINTYVNNRKRTEREAKLKSSSAWTLVWNSWYGVSTVRLHDRACMDHGRLQQTAAAAGFMAYHKQKNKAKPRRDPSGKA